MSPNEIAEPRLSYDFAQRVLIEADRIVARRRRVAAGAFLFSLAAVVSLVGLSTREVGQLRAPVSIPLAPSGDDQTNALSYLFPDAAPVARFAADYSDEAVRSGNDSDILPSLDDTEPP